MTRGRSQLDESSLRKKPAAEGRNSEFVALIPEGAISLPGRAAKPHG